MKSLNLIQKMLSAFVITVFAIGSAVVTAAPAQASNAVVEGRVLDASGKPIKGIGAKLSCRGGSRYSNFHAATDAQGRYSIGTLATDNCTIYFEDCAGVWIETWEGPYGWTYERNPGTYAPRWYLNGNSPETATSFPVAPYETKHLNDVVLTSEGRKKFTDTPTPVILGTAAVGSTVFVPEIAWTPQATLFTTWYRDGVQISGMGPETGAILSYRLRPEDAGHKITVAFSGYAPGYAYTMSTMSAPISPPILTFASTANPTVAGTPQIGKRLTANGGSWTPSTTQFGYQWYRSGMKISGAISQHYVPTHADHTKTLTVAVTGRATGYNPVTTISAPTTPVAWGGAVPLRAVEVLGTSDKIGSKFTASPLEPGSGATLKYQWYRSGKPIQGANSKTYKTVGADGGRSIKVSVTASASGYDSTTKYSWSTSIPKGTLKSKKPTIVGTKKVGRTLTVKSGTWTSATKFKYQWYRSGTPIKGAVNKTYKLAKVDRTRSVKVRVTGSKTGYMPTSRYSSGYWIR